MESVIELADGLPCRLREAFDLGFLKRYGQVFRVFDDQDSGNLCFGVRNGENRYFVKFAGAPTARYEGEPADAVARLKATLPIYESLHHPNLIPFRFSEETGGGFAMVFDWVDAECMGKMYPESRAKFMELPDEKRMDVFDTVLSFLQSTAEQGYAAVDFYDGSILYDFGAEKTWICDIDFFVRKPYRNEMGRMWGSSRFMSPEEFQLGAPIDERTNVYLAGAVAFALFGGETDRSREQWRLSTALYNVAKRAVSDRREDRCESLTSLAEAWENARSCEVAQA